MIRINAFLELIDPAKKGELVELAKELVGKSRADHGCVAYDFFESATIDCNMMYCETWASQADLDAHIASAHFQEIVPKIEKLAVFKIEKFEF